MDVHYEHEKHQFNANKRIRGETKNKCMGNDKKWNASAMKSIKKNRYFELLKFVHLSQLGKFSLIEILP